MAGHLRGVGDVFASFLDQDSGCQSFGVEVEGDRWFVKVPVEARAVPSVRRAVALHGKVRHPAVIPLLGTMSTDLGPALVYPWVDGMLLYGPGGGRTRFGALPVPEVLAAIDSVFDAHLVLAAAGFVAVDLYDGCFLYDFDRRRIRMCDLDEYRPGPFQVEGDRLPGSKRFMAPEEFCRGALIDERTTVFNLGRTAQVLLGERSRPGAVLARATDADHRRRYGTVAYFVAEWRLIGERLFV